MGSSGIVAKELIPLKASNNPRNLSAVFLM
jgi:hypothetical protein